MRTWALVPLVVAGCASEVPVMTLEEALQDPEVRHEGGPVILVSPVGRWSDLLSATTPDGSDPTWESFAFDHHIEIRPAARLPFRVGCDLDQPMPGLAECSPGVPASVAWVRGQFQREARTPSVAQPRSEVRGAPLFTWLPAGPRLFFEATQLEVLDEISEQTILEGREERALQASSRRLPRADGWRFNPDLTE